ncbi:MAG: hypothetical protein AAF541_19295 [Pseudomonadota bacterium]
MLTKADDYPIHQTPEPIAYTGATRNFYDRYFFNGYHLEEDIFFAAAMGVYPYVNVIDGAFSLIIDGVQHNVLASRILHMERMDTHVGPVRIEVVEPLHQLRLVIEDPEHDLRADLLFTSRALAQEEPRFTRRVGTALFMDYTRLTQNGVWQGWIESKGRRIEVTPEKWLGTRDRSWGVRNVGAADPQPNPYSPDGFQFYWLWAPINFSDGISLYHLNDDELGRPWNTNGVWVPLRDTGQGSTEMARVSSHIDFISGTRHAKRAEIRFESQAGQVSEIVMSPRFHWYMKGVGYGHPEFNHGSYHGELESTYEEYALADVDDATNLHIQAISDVQMSGDLGSRTGKGVLEQLIIGPHAPSGFTQTMDMAQ